MLKKNNSNALVDSADARKDYWFKQYASAYTEGDKRAAALALRFVQQYDVAARRTEEQHS